MNPFNTEAFLAISSPSEACMFLWDHYCSRKRIDSYEPSWSLEPYALAKKFLDTKEENMDSVFNEQDYFVLNELVKTHRQKDGTEVPVRTGFPNEGSRIMHDCWKAGSFTWIFMGRLESEVTPHHNFVVISRTLPDEFYSHLEPGAPQTLFAAYDKFDITKKIGPAVTLELLLEELDKGEKYV